MGRNKNFTTVTIKKKKTLQAPSLLKYYSKIIQIAKETRVEPQVKRLTYIQIPKKVKEN
jgi:hypothetical protein